MSDDWKNRISSNVKNKYNEERPLLTIRSDLPGEILKFIKKLKRLNKGSQWINEAIEEKYKREKNKTSVRFEVRDNGRYIDLMPGDTITEGKVKITYKEEGVFKIENE